MALLSLAALKHRPYARLWTGAFVSNIGTWMETVAIGIYVTEATGQAAWTGTVAAAGFVPIALLGPVGGALADRMSRRVLLMTTTLVQTGLAALLTTLFVIGAPSAPVVTLIVFAGGIASALGFPAFQAMLPDLVPEEDLRERGCVVVRPSSTSAASSAPRSRASSSRSAATRGRWA